MIDTDTGHHVTRLAGTACEAVHTITCLTASRPAIPAPACYGTFIELEELGYQLGQALVQLGEALLGSLIVFDVYEEDPARDPLGSVMLAQAALAEASSSALQLGGAVGVAINAIAGQGYRDTESRADR